MQSVVVFWTTFLLQWPSMVRPSSSHPRDSVDPQDRSSVADVPRKTSYILMETVTYFHCLLAPRIDPSELPPGEL